MSTRKDGSTTSTNIMRAGDGRVLRRIASFFDKSDTALRLLKKYYRSGFIITPDGKMALDDFYRSHRAAWTRRNQSGAPHSVSILEKCFQVEFEYGISFFGGTSEPFTLDDIENCRDFDGQYEARYGKYERD